tara:strand:- start:407 stop:643 length:237 start_codon:yes stop_codon:yes gene_type:complete
MLQYSDNYKISNYKIYMDTNVKIKELKEKINELQNLIEDFVDSHHAKKNKIGNLESEIVYIKENMNKYLDDLEELVDK